MNELTEEQRTRNWNLLWDLRRNVRYFAKRAGWFDAVHRLSWAPEPSPPSRGIGRALAFGAPASSPSSPPFARNMITPRRPRSAAPSAPPTSGSSKRPKPPEGLGCRRTPAAALPPPIGASNAHLKRPFPPPLCSSCPIVRTKSLSAIWRNDAILSASSHDGSLGWHFSSARFGSGDGPPNPS